MKYTEEMLREAVGCSTSVAGVLRALGVRPTGGSHAHLSRRIKRAGIDTSHFTGRAHNAGQLHTIGRSGPRSSYFNLREAPEQNPVYYAGLWSRQAFHTRARYAESATSGMTSR